MSDPAPRVSILIPNYNNGTASSRDGKTDLIADLLQSLHDSLQDDPTPIEQGIPVYYNDLHLGGVSFAVLADRMWKSAPKSTTRRSCTLLTPMPL